MSPGAPVAAQLFGRARAPGGDQRFEGREPMAVIGIPAVGIAGGLRRPDLLRQRRGPFGPAEKTPLMQEEGHRKSLRLPGLAENGTAVITLPARRIAGPVVHDTGSRYGSHASIDTLWFAAAPLPHNSRPVKTTV